MGEEEKKPEEKKMEEKKEEKKPEEKPAAAEEKKAVETKEAPPPPPPPQEIVLKVYMHCEGCARKVRRCLKGFEGVEDVTTDCKTSKVVVKGEKADPLKVLDRVQKKSNRKVELISPIPKPKAEEEKKPEEKEKPKPEEKKEEVISVVLKVFMHCEACAQEIKKRILRMKGVESAEPDLKASLVTVKGVFDPPKLVEYVYKRTGKQAVIVKQEPEKKEKEEGKDGKEEKKGEEGGGDKGGKGEGEKKEGEKGEAKAEAAAAEPAAAAPATTEEVNKVVEMQNSAYLFYPPRDMGIYAYYQQQQQQQRDPAMELQAYYQQQQRDHAMELQAYNRSYPPQIFSDENPNACSIM